MKYLQTTLLGILTVLTGFLLYQFEPVQDTISVGSSTFGSAWFITATGPQYVASLTDGCAEWSSNILTTTGTACGAGGSSLHVDGGGFVYPQTGDYHSAPKYVATSTTASSTFVGLTATNVNVSGYLLGTLTGNADTATALAANGANCSAGNAPLGVDASGAVESCFDVWTEAENTAASYIALTDLSATFPITYDNGTGVFTWSGLATSSALAANEILYATANNTLAGTSSISSAFIADDYLLNTGDTGVGDYVFSGGKITFENASGTALNLSSTNVVFGSSTASEAYPTVYGTAPAWQFEETDAGVAGSIVMDDGDISFNVDNAGVDTVKFNTDVDPSGWGFVDDILPANNNTEALGSASTGNWADLFLGTGSVINWFNGDITLTHSSNLLTLAGGGLDAGGATSLEIPNGASPTVDATGEVAWDTTIGQALVYNGSSVDVLFDTIPRSLGSIGSTSQDRALNSFSSATTTWSLGSVNATSTIPWFRAYTSGGTCLARIGDGSATSGPISITTTETATTSIGNVTFIPGDRPVLEIGSCASSPNYVTPTFGWAEVRQ